MMLRIEQYDNRQIYISVPRVGTVVVDTSSLAAAFRTAGCANTSECFLTSRLLDSDSVSGSTFLAPDNHQWLTLWRDAMLSTASLRIETKAVSLSPSDSLSLSLPLCRFLCLSFCACPCLMIIRNALLRLSYCSITSDVGRGCRGHCQLGQCICSV